MWPIYLAIIAAAAVPALGEITLTYKPNTKNSSAGGADAKITSKTVSRVDGIFPFPQELGVVGDSRWFHYFIAKNGNLEAVRAGAPQNGQYRVAYIELMGLTKEEEIHVRHHGSGWTYNFAKYSVTIDWGSLLPNIYVQDNTAFSFVARPNASKWKLESKPGGWHLIKNGGGTWGVEACQSDAVQGPPVVLTKLGGLAGLLSPVRVAELPKGLKEAKWAGTTKIENFQVFGSKGHSNDAIAVQHKNFIPMTKLGQNKKPGSPPAQHRGVGMTPFWNLSSAGGGSRAKARRPAATCEASPR